MKESLSEKLKWKSVNLKSSIYPVCAIFFVISLIAIIIICYNFKPDSPVYSLGNSIFTGIIASIIVTVIIQKKQDKEQFERKRAVLFDAGFYLKKFEQDYNEKKKTNIRLDDDREQLFELCREPAKYLSKMYRNGSEVLDVVDISILRSINSKYRFIISSSKTINALKKDKKFLREPEEIVEVHDWFGKEIKELKENLFYLLIKWEKDSVIDYEIPHS